MRGPLADCVPVGVGQGGQPRPREDARCPGLLRRFAEARNWAMPTVLHLPHATRSVTRLAST